MSIYVVGDIQGCFEPLQCLLKKVNFNEDRDQLWCAGDLVNRGPDSLSTLRFLYERRDRVRVVLGNHDLHLLAVAAGAKKPNPSDTVEAVLNAPDADLMLDWLRQQPLLYHDQDTVMVHAGIAPQWTLEQAKQYAGEVEAVLRGPNYRDFFRHMYGNKPCRWRNKLEGWERLRVITNYFTRMRYCTPEGALDLISKGPHPKPESGHVMPWFKHPGRLTVNHTIVFGHWASIEGVTNTDNVIALDTGCVWGGALTAWEVESRQRMTCLCNSKQPQHCANV